MENNMKMLFVILCSFVFAVSSTATSGKDIPNEVPVATISILAQVSSETAIDEAITGQTVSQTYQPTAIPILSPEEAAKANEDALQFYHDKKIRFIIKRVSFAVVLFLCITALFLLKKYGILIHSKASKTENGSRDPGIRQENRLLFLDILKGIAIIAVISDHSICWSRLCPLSFLPGKLTYFSVSLFIMCAGYTSAMSLENARKKNVSTQSWIIKKTTHIIYYYFIATAFYLFMKDFDHIVSFSSFVNAIINFNAVSPLYFIAFFLQLLCIAPLTFGFFSAKDTQKRFLAKTVVFLFIICFSFFCKNHTRFGTIYGGGRYLFGGTYLMVYVFGQIVYIYRNILLSKKISAAALGVSLLTLCILHTPFFSKSPNVTAINPPGLIYIFYAVSIFFAVTFLFSFNDSSRIRAKVLYPVSFFGKYSFEIFLYHVAVIRLLDNYFRYNNGQFGAWRITDANMHAFNIFFEKALVFPNTTTAHFLAGGLAFVSYMLIPAWGAILYRILKKYYTSFSKGEKNAVP